HISLYISIGFVYLLYCRAGGTFLLGAVAFTEWQNHLNSDDASKHSLRQAKGLVEVFFRVITTVQYTATLFLFVITNIDEDEEAPSPVRYSMSKQNIFTHFDPQTNAEAKSNISVALL
uniref:Uncharacterized protein n=1 Tax=Glossina palpalis gambiensis TaxID=67801 RepID=A0A1B0BTL8_9MUSC